jgi:hypothetical protein
MTHRIARRAVKALAVAAVAVAAFAGGYLAHQPHTVTKTVTVVRTQDDVASFNDGWLTALDDVARAEPSLAHSYDGLNAGITVGSGCTGAGFETRGNVGPFTDLCQ